MKIVLRIIIAFVAIVSLFALMVILMLTGGGRSLAGYYSDRNNYDKLNVEVSYIYQNDDNIFLTLITDNSNYYGSFVLDDKNAQAAIRNGFFEEVSVGNKITIYSAPGYFGDGYSYPIVGIEKNEKIYLDFDTGISNQIQHEKYMHVKAICLIIITIIIIIICVLYYVITIRSERKRRDNVYFELPL